MKKSTMFLAGMLSLVMVASGCSAAWVTTLDSILAAAAPALVNILNIIAIAEGKPINAALAAKINADAASIKSLAADFSNASAATGPQVCSQLQSAITVYQTDQQQVLALAQVVDPKTQQKIVILSGLVAGTAEAILAVLPSCQSPVVAKIGSAPPLPIRQFIVSYNAELVKPTGNAAVDNFTKSHRVHSHSKFLRVLTLGLDQ